VNSEQHHIGDRLKKLLSGDPLLQPYEKILERRLKKIEALQQRLTGGELRLPDFASGHEYFGLHFRNGEWVFREWAPNAKAVVFIGEATDWEEKKAFALDRINDEGVWEIRFSRGKLAHGMLYRLRIHWPEGMGDRVPAYARRVVQDPHTFIFNAQIWHPPSPFRWRRRTVRRVPEPLLIYEAHVGMAQEEERIGTYAAFTENVLPRIIRSGYNTLQLMAVQEHPYYASFGYHVSNFFAASSRFGTPEDLKQLIDAAHAGGLRVIMDLVHSHAASNEVEGLSRFDGTPYQFFHDGPRGMHRAWDSRCFDYGKHQVIHFLLSNCRFWLDEYRVDGFRFDGITSMLYLHHGLGKAFTSYQDYFDDSVDEDALAYLALANRIVHDLRPDAVTIAEDMSGMPGLAAPASQGGIGFDFRFAMGIPDYWIKLTKETRDEDWPMGHLWRELTNRRKEEKTISYAESHDQALVGDQTLAFRLMGAAMYDHMGIRDDHMAVDRGMALIKMIRLITLATAGHGYLNFMGNEFGHPEWIDFPREGNGWSYKYARRQWHLADDPALKYAQLAQFDRDMVRLAKDHRVLECAGPYLLHEHNDDNVIVCSRGALVFAFNFHPNRSYTDYCFDAPAGKYHMILNSDDASHGGHGRLTSDQTHDTLERGEGRHYLSLYLPARTAVVLVG
jgi:1,4-alpha-glucan branching enzyme